MYTDPLSTGDHTPAPTPAVSPAQTPPATPTVDINNLVSDRLNSERRIRELQSVADQKRAEAEKALAEKEAALKELDQHKSVQSSVIDGAAKIAQDLTRQMNELKASMEQERAERLRAEALLNFPELKPYASLIPASSDPAKMAEIAQAFKAARDADVATLPQPVNTPSPVPSNASNVAREPNILDLFKQGYIPPASPAHVSPAGTAQSGVNQQIADKMAAALANGNALEFEKAVKEASALNDQYVAQTVGYHPQVR